MAKYSKLSAEKKARAKQYVTERRRRVMQMARDLLGGKCSRCGYDKCQQALEFHHVDPNNKKFTVGSGCTFGWAKVKAEVEKCILLCANCHREVENDAA